MVKRSIYGGVHSQAKGLVGKNPKPDTSPPPPPGSGDLEKRRAASVLPPRNTRVHVIKKKRKKKGMCTVKKHARCNPGVYIRGKNR